MNQEEARGILDDWLEEIIAARKCFWLILNWDHTTAEH